VRVDRRDGTIRVTAHHVGGALRWGATLGQENATFFNEATCVNGAKARRCVLGDVGTPERVTPPASCIVFLADGGAASCAAYVGGCRPTPPPPPCALFPANNVWNADVSALDPHSQSDAWVASIGETAHLHPDFGGILYRGAPIGIPYSLVPTIQPLVPISFIYDDESDPGPYPVPPLVAVEGSARPGVGRGDAHVLLVEQGSCRLSEIFAAKRLRKGKAWKAGSGARWDLGSNALRAAGDTSADAAGLPILPGLVRYDEILAGEIHHALRFTAPRTQRAFLWPARHQAGSSDDPNLPPMGARFRLKSGYDISGFSPTNRIILTALKRYGMFLADNGSSWFLSGVPDTRWDDDDLHALTSISGTAFEAVDESSLMLDPDSGQVP
jgi:hypothetical protein